jgi:hypothetical protein
LAECSSSEGRAVRPKRVNHAIKQEDRAFSACTGVRLVYGQAENALA